MKRHLQTPLVVLLLFLAVWVPRVPALAALVTTDEPLWLLRSANFYQAISHGDFIYTFQREHPGVTVTWAGTLGFLQLLPGYAQQAPGQLAKEQLEPWLRERGTIEPLQLLAAGRWWMVLWISLITAAAYFPLRKLFNMQIAVLAVLFMAWGPFFHRPFAAASPGRSACHSDRVCSACLFSLAAWWATASLLRHFGPRRGPGLAHQDAGPCVAAHRWAVAPT